MTDIIRRTRFERPWWRYPVIAAVLVSAVALGFRPSVLWLVVPIGIAAILVLLRQPLLGFFALILAALLANASFGTGTEVTLNPAVLVMPVLIVIWILIRMTKHSIQLAPSRVNLPLALFLLSGLLSLFIGNVTWDPVVPRAANFTIVQFAQLAIFYFSAAAFWLAGNLIKDEIWLRRLTACYLVVAGILAIVRVIPGGDGLLLETVTYAVNRAPFWMLLTAVTTGQLLYNRNLSTRWRVFLIAILVAVVLFVFGYQKERVSNWVGVVIVVGVLIWLRVPRVRLATAVAIILFTASGVLSQFVYDFAGGDAKWDESGGSRLALSGAVIRVAMRNPITGLGPAAYRPYGRTTPLQYQGAYYSNIGLSSHNNYVDLFAHGGIVGLGLFLWFMTELALLQARLRKYYPDGFTGGYVNGMLAAWFAIMVIMVLADWFLPFVYNLGFEGFQSSILVWMFFGGTLALEQMARQRAARQERDGSFHPDRQLEHA